MWHDEEECGWYNSYFAQIFSLTRNEGKYREDGYAREREREREERKDRTKQTKGCWHLFSESLSCLFSPSLSDAAIFVHFLWCRNLSFAPLIFLSLNSSSHLLTQLGSRQKLKESETRRQREKGEARMTNENTIREKRDRELVFSLTSSPHLLLFFEFFT